MVLSVYSKPTRNPPLPGVISCFGVVVDNWEGTRSAPHSVEPRRKRDTMITLDGSTRPGEEAERNEDVPSDRTVPHDGDGEPLPIEEVFHVLKDGRRRLVLSCLGRQDDPVDLDELVEYVLVHENDGSGSRRDTGEQKRVHIDLHHRHLPLMADLGAVDIDEPRRTVGTGPRFGSFEGYLGSDGGERTATRRWNRWYLLLSALGVVLFAAGLVVSDPAFTRAVFGLLVGTLAACSFLGWRASAEAPGRKR